MTDVLSVKQIDSYKHSNSRINIWQGAVRSGKTFISILRFIKELRDGPPGNAMIVGVSREALQRNIVTEISSLIGVKPPTPKSNEWHLFGRNIYLIGASDERSENRIRGVTLAIAYVDEATLIPQGFFRMLLSRLSVEGAKMFATTNPDSPYHWLKRDFLDRKELNLSTWRFSLSDNPSLPEQYVIDLRKEYSGLWQSRYIDGEWTLAEGTYYGSELSKLRESGQVGRVPHDPATCVYTAWDLGVGDSTVIIFYQIIAKEIHIIDGYDNNGEGLAHYARVVKRLSEEHGYNYANHFAPHDIEVRELGNDAKTRRETARELGIDFEVLPRFGIEDGIDLVRNTIHRCWFDGVRCEGLLGALESYHQEWNKRLGVPTGRPCHDWSSHYSDGFRYLCQSLSRIENSNSTSASSVEDLHSRYSI